MKATIKKGLFALVSLWHCAVSFISPCALLFTFACFADVNNDDGYAATFICGCFLLFLWALLFLPSFFYLTSTLKRRKKIFAFIPLSVFVLFSVIGVAVIGFPSIGEVLSDIFVVFNTPIG